MEISNADRVVIKLSLEISNADRVSKVKIGAETPGKAVWLCAISKVIEVES